MVNIHFANKIILVYAMKEAREIFQKSVSLTAELRAAFLAANQEAIVHAALKTASSFATGGKLLLSQGNPSEMAQYLADKFIGGFFMARPPLPALMLSPCGAMASAGADTVEFYNIQQRQMEAIARPGDILLAISDKAGNIAPPLLAAREKGLFTIGLGEIEGDLLPLCDIAIRAPEYPRAWLSELNLAFANLYGRLVDYFLFENPLAGKQEAPNQP